jgi:putative hydrolase of the HAD superfamily
VRYRCGTMRYRLVCLDAGFTTLSPRRTLAESLAELLAEHGHSATEADVRRGWEAAQRWFWEEYNQADNRTWLSDDSITETWRGYHGVMLRELGVTDADGLTERILAGQFSPDSWEPYPDVVPLLEELAPYRARGELQVGIVSDWGSTLREIFVALELDRHLDFVLASAAVGAAKPSPALFRMALERAGARPAEGIMVGDAYRADVLGARSAGMDAVLLDREGDAGPDVEGPVIRSLAELPAILEAGADAHHATSAVDADRSR